MASGDALGRIAAFAAGWYVARTMGPEMFGVMTFAQAVVLYFTHLAACGVDLTGIRDVALDPTKVRTLVPSLLSFRTLVSAGLVVLLASFALLALPLLDGVVLALYSLTLFGHGPNAKLALLGLSRAKPVAIARTAGEVLYVVLVLAFAHQRGDIVYVPWAQALGDILAVLLMFFALKRMGHAMPVELDWPAVKPVLQRSFPLVLNILLGLMIFNSDLIALRFCRDRTTVGWYSASYQLISFLINMAWAYSYSLLPALTQATPENGERHALYQTSLAQSFAVGLPLAVGGSLLAAPLIALVFGAAYEPSGPPLAILICSLPFMLYKDVAMIALIVSGREKTVMRMTAIAVVFNLVLIALVIPKYGMLGAASATLATEVLRAVLAAYYVKKEGFAVVHPRRLWKSALAALVMAGVLIALHGQPLFVALFAALRYATLAYLATLLALGALAYLGTLLALGGIELRRGSIPALSV